MKETNNSTCLWDIKTWVLKQWVNISNSEPPIAAENVPSPPAGDVENLGRRCQSRTAAMGPDFVGSECRDFHQKINWRFKKTYVLQIYIFKFKKDMPRKGEKPQ